MPSKLSPIWMIGANVSLVVTVMPLRSRVTLLAWIVMALPTMAPMLRVRTYVPGWLMLVTWKIGTRPSSARAVATPIATRNNPRITGFFIGVLLSCPSCHTDSRAPGGQAARRIDWRARFGFRGPRRRFFAYDRTETSNSRGRLGREETDGARYGQHEQGRVNRTGVARVPARRQIAHGRGDAGRGLHALRPGLE